MTEPAQPMQPVIVDAHGVHRFKSNAVVCYLLDRGGIDLNALAIAYQTGDGFPAEDMRQFMQLIGYSVSGWGGLTDYRSDGGDVFAEQDPAYDAATPGNSDGECIARARSMAMRLAADILIGSPTGRRLAVA